VVRAPRKEKTPGSELGEDDHAAITLAHKEGPISDITRGKKVQMQVRTGGRGSFLVLNRAGGNTREAIQKNKDQYT